jgi:SOS response regulatory protein OraA/RecX
MKATNSTPAYDNALSAALKLLRGRDRFEAEIREECRNIGCATEVVDQVVAFLSEKRMLNDERLAIAVARNISYKKLLSRERIAAQLALRGAPIDAIDAAVATLPEDQYVAERLWKITKGDTSKRLRKLSSNGFDDDVIARWAPQ